jgi:hypothetical protein
MAPPRGDLPERAVADRAGRPREGIEILEAGVQLPARAAAAGPRLLRYVYLHDAQRAAILNEAAELPGAAFAARSPRTCS